MEPNEEPEFLHALATPLGTALILADTLMENSTLKKNLSPGEVAQLQDLVNTLEGIRKTLRQRQERVAQRYVGNNK